MRALQLIAKAAGALLLVYAAFIGFIFIAMHQPPDRFGQIMARVPGPLFGVMPFEPLWNVARAGALEVGDIAPDFALQTADRKSRVQLSSFRGKQPVVLVFGSYT